MAAVLTPRQLDDWAAYAAVEPFGPPADDYRAGLLAWAAHSPHVKNPARYKPADYVPQWAGARRPPMSGADYKAKAFATYAGVTAALTARK